MVGRSEHGFEMHRFDRVIFIIPLIYYYKINELVQSCKKFWIKLEIIPDYIRHFPSQPSIEMIENILIINIHYVPLDDSFNKLLKSISDYAIDIISIIILSFFC